MAACAFLWEGFLVSEAFKDHMSSVVFLQGYNYRRRKWWEHKHNNYKKSRRDKDHQQVEKSFCPATNITVVEDPCKGETRDDVEDNESGVDVGHHEELLLTSEWNIDVDLHSQVWEEIGQPAEANEEGKRGHGSGEGERLQGLHFLSFIFCWLYTWIFWHSNNTKY